MAGAPPTDISPERLFRLLLTSPRASSPVDLPVDWADGGAFRVYALRPDDEAAVQEAAERGGANYALRREHAQAEMVALSLWVDGERAFPGAVGLMSALDALDARLVVSAVVGVLARISPLYRATDSTAWLNVLQRGADHNDNRTQAHALACCVDGDIRHGPPRPWLYWGCAARELTDGQWMAFRAARAALLGD